MDETSIVKKLEQTEVLPFKSMAVDRDEDIAEMLNDGEKIDLDSKGKTKICYDEAWRNQVKDGSVSDPGKSSTSASNVSNNLNSSNSELSYHDDDDEDDDEYADDVSDYDGNDDFLYDDDYLTMQSQFDNVDLPPGVEASLPWLKVPDSTEHAASESSTLTILDFSDSKRKATIPDLTESKRMATNCNLTEAKCHVASSSSPTVTEEFSTAVKEEIEENGVVPQYQFKQFDTVDDYSDHHYLRMGFLDGEQPPKAWTKKIQEEWKVLEQNLPDTIFVRVYEGRMELLRAVMVGPSGTPYHDGLFVFDCFFPRGYPNEPPMVYYYSGGLRLNPNLYECGKVCLSLLGTWTGRTTEMWNPKKSTMLQVLVSIQALILNAKPFFNEPGYESTYTGEEGDRKSKTYNEDVFILSLKTMIYTLRRPPKHFEALVADHFRNRALDILVACKGYKDGAVVGTCVVKDGVLDDSQLVKGASAGFKTKVGQLMKMLVANFTRNGSKDCEQFLT